MVEKARRSRVDGDRRGTPLPQWEVFVREEETDPLRHVGSVAATDGEDAADRASRLFGWYAADLWVCPAETVERYSTRSLSAAASDGEVDSEPNSVSEEASEPRVREETEGTPRVNES